LEAKEKMMNTNLKKFVVGLAILAVVATGTVVAQNTDNGRDWRQGPPSVEDILARMSDVLALSDQQAVELLVVLQEHAAQRAALHEQSMALIGPEICDQKARAEDDILAILTPEQAEQFLQMREERKAKAAGRSRSRGSRGPDCEQYDSDS